MTKKLDELQNQDKEPTQEEIEQWYKDWETLSDRLDKNYSKIMKMFNVIKDKDANK